MSSRSNLTVTQKTDLVSIKIQVSRAVAEYFMFTNKAETPFFIDFTPLKQNKISFSRKKCETILGVKGPWTPFASKRQWQSDDCQYADLHKNNQSLEF